MVRCTGLALRRDVQAAERNRLSMHKWNWNSEWLRLLRGSLQNLGERSMDSILEQNEQEGGEKKKGKEAGDYKWIVGSSNHRSTDT